MQNQTDISTHIQCEPNNLALLINQSVDLILVISLLISFFIYIVIIIRSMYNYKQNLNFLEKIIIFIFFTVTLISALTVLIYLNIYQVNIIIFFAISIIGMLYSCKGITKYDILDLINCLLLLVIPLECILLWQELDHCDFSQERLDLSGIHKELNWLDYHFGHNDRNLQLILDNREGATLMNRSMLENIRAMDDIMGADHDIENIRYFQQGDIKSILSKWYSNQSYLDILEIRDPTLRSPINQDSYLYLSERQNVLQGFINQLLPSSTFNNTEDFRRLSHISINFGNDLHEYLPRLKPETVNNITNRYILETLHYNLDNENNYRGIAKEFILQDAEYANISPRDVITNFMKDNSIIIFVGTIILSVGLGIAIPNINPNPYLQFN